ncbi:MAG TPA: fatty acid desaturase CarF family protein [Syntrophales bacterium]|nr:fatty acid desaturase CarF family protein [Syntrophales bacterium]
MALTEKQEQFNAAMARFASNRAYTLFGRFIASANIFLQIYLLFCVWHHSIGVLGQVFAFMVAYVLADLINGLVHIYMDNNDRYDSIAGPLVANFHMHHKIPRYRKNNLAVVYFNETGSKVWLVGYLVAVLVLVEMGLPPVISYILVYIGILSSVAEVSHYLCHTSNAKMSILLGNMGVLLAKRHHAHHHLENNVSYAFLNGFTDQLLNLIAAKFYKGYKQTTDLHYLNYAVANEDER